MPGKFANEKCWMLGEVFHSRLEARRYIFLKRFEDEGLIRDLQIQVPFLLGQGKRRRTYIADFTYELNGNTVVEDVKSSVTAKETKFQSKARQLFREQGIEIRLVFSRDIPYLDGWLL